MSDTGGQSRRASSGSPSRSAARFHGSDQQRLAQDADDATRFYDRWASLYDLLATYAPFVGRLRRRAIDALCLERGDTVLEIGCGTGANLQLLAREVGPRGTVIGVDRSRGVLERARRNARGYPQVEVLRADGTQLPLAAPGSETGPEDPGLDGVLATFVVGMLEEPAASVDQWIDHLGPDGHVALLHLRRSEHAFAPLANSALSVATILSTPPTTKLRYERDLSHALDARVRAAGDVVHERTDPTLTESHLFDLVELTAGRRR
ncbi:methyltransferase type 11 [Salinarchaeum sp. Harcht-Bsk1]|uniref:class I SAM-dependent methyltransferase n=1 Tax=Salinarchaeum sp. Harcht-Bsk1 TaxID=1333523 RepID=UPI000342475A|nr:methyltransferase domain-containing protein [Salinarchaeum sp. Harcht-Bsk1]AGN00584.1 methyltransferase type 11 [Salinarchaeum sp. Harcht-Bsk1]